MLLSTFFMRYRAETGAAVANVERLDKANEKLGKSEDAVEKKQSKSVAAKKRRAATAKKETKEQAASLKEVSAGARDATRSLSELGKGGARSVGGLRTATSVLLSTLSKVGPAGALAAAGVAAIGGGLLIGMSGAEDARQAAANTAAFGQSAFDARLSNGELLRLQDMGRSRGLVDEETNSSAVGVNAKSTEMRAAQRQAARDPASAFNNPVIKAANLWKKAGVDVGAALETQIEQQDRYLKKLASTGQEEKALVEGTQLFGRTLLDTKSVIASAKDATAMSSTELAKESGLRRQLNKDSEALQAAENKLSIEKKRAEDQILRNTVPATIKLTEATIEWTKATAGLRESWALFMTDMINGLTSLTQRASEFVFKTGISEGTQAQKDKFRVESAGEMAYRKARANDYRGNTKDAGEQARKAAEAAEWVKIKAERAAPQQPVSQSAADLIMEELIYTTNASQDELQRVSELLANDPSIRTAQDALAVAREQLAAEKESGKVQGAQLELDKKIESNTAALINTGLEQAMSMWAAGVGKGASVGSGQFRGEERGHYEERMKMLLRTVQPNVGINMLEARSTLGAASQQATQLNQANPQASAAGSKGGVSLTVEKLDVSVVSSQDASGMSTEIAYAVRDELKYAVNEFADARVS